MVRWGVGTRLNEKKYRLMIQFIPPIETRPTNELIGIVYDHKGNWQGEAIDRAKEKLSNLLQRLISFKTFCSVAFKQHFSYIWVWEK